MRYYSRLQKIKERKKRNLIYRKVVRVAVVPIVFVFAVLMYLSMVSENLEEVDQKEKAAKAIKTEVAGEKTEKSTQKSPVRPTAKPTLTPLPTNTPSPTLIATIVSPTNTPIPLPTPTSDKLAIPNYLTRHTGNNTMSISQGTIAFKVVVNWQDEDQILFWGNFNGEDRKNLIEIVGSGNWIAFNIHNDAGEEDGSDSPNGNMGDDYFGKTFNILVTWDFTGDTKIKRVYINAELKREVYAETTPSVTNSQVLIGKITDLKISDKWEDR